MGRRKLDLTEEEHLARIADKKRKRAEYDRRRREMLIMERRLLEGEWPEGIQDDETQETVGSDVDVEEHVKEDVDLKMTLTEADSDPLIGCEVPEKKMKLNDLDEESILCDCDIFSTVDAVLKNFDIQKEWNKKADELTEKLQYVNDLERSFIDIDILFDKMERDVKKLRQKISQTSATTTTTNNNNNHQEVHFLDVYSKAENRMISRSTGANNVFRTPHPPKVLAARQLPQIQNDYGSEVIPVGRYVTKPPDLPPEGPVERKPLTIGSKVFATRGNPLGVWYKARIIEERKGDDDVRQYKIKFDYRKTLQQKLYNSKQLAYAENPNVILPVGMRVIAMYTDEAWSPHSALYAGVIAEPPKPANRYRYLVFFDDGYAQYVAVNEAHLVCDANDNVWEDIHPDSKDFIKAYLEKYPERPMLRLQKGQIVKTEWKGRWWVAKVLEVDSSMVKMYFEADKRTEWIYRGSTRLGPLYEALMAAEQSRQSGGRARRHNLMHYNSKLSRPYVEYTRSMDEPFGMASRAEATNNSDGSRPMLAKKHTGGVSRNVARKSTTQERKELPEVTIVPPPPSVSQTGTRKLNHYMKEEVFQRTKYKQHECSSTCLKNYPDDPLQHRGKNPLSIPILLGWYREMIKLSRKFKRVVFYTTPCGRRVRSMQDVARYLAQTKSLLTVDQFSFDQQITVFAEFIPAVVKSIIKDLTYGKEMIPVVCVNSLDSGYPDYMEYSEKRSATSGVNLNLDSGFLCGCDCEDDCLDKEKCGCQQLTVSATEALRTGKIPDAGYKYRRLNDPLITGVFECNELCKCSSRCVNKVIQNGLSIRLQVFKTEERGWGVRCLDDLAQGSFICNYAGQLLTEQGANEDGNQYGDEYLAELDHIEVVEKQKEGYESDVVDPEHLPEEKPPPAAKPDQAYDEETDDSLSAGYSEIHEGTDSDYDAPVDMDTVVKTKTITRSQRQSRRKKNGDKDSLSVLDSRADSRKKTEDWLKNFPESPASEDSGLPPNTPNASGDEAQNSPAANSKESKAKRSLRSSTSRDESDGPQKSTRSLRSKRLTRSSSAKEQKDEQASNSDSGESKESSIRTKSQLTSDAETDEIRKSPRFSNLKELPKPKEHQKKVPFKPTRSFFNEEYCYIMDAKTRGNIGRYLNHSCNPNVFVQNVFVDTHDLRFPWVAFFASRYIRAGTELTWDYNYDVGSVPGKVMYCRCGAEECRGRLL